MRVCPAVGRRRESAVERRRRSNSAGERVKTNEWQWLRNQLLVVVTDIELVVDPRTEVEALRRS